MEAIINVFRMKEISPKTRVRIITKLGQAIDDENGMNITGELVRELVEILEAEKES